MSNLSPQDWQQIEELYCAVLERDPAEREEILADAPPLVRQAVERMLASSSGGNILDRTLWIDSEPTAPRVFLQKGTEIGPYTILGLIGEGGASSVYRASDVRLNREVAIKVLPQSVPGNQSRLRQFEIEARAAGSLNHPNILTVHDVGSHQGVFYLVTEFLDGETLRARLNRGKLSRQEALAYARMIAAGLAGAHAKNIIHRDLKPENLFVTGDGRLKILDFGLAKFSAPERAGLITSPVEDVSKTLPPMIVGTVGYMSPEQVQGLPIDIRSDIFNAGIVLFEMLTGRRPFAGATPLETLRNTLETEPRLDDVPEIDPGIARFLHRCLENDPRNRFQSAADLLQELEVLDKPPAPLLSRRHLAYLGGGAVVAAGFAWLGSRAGLPRPTTRLLTPGLRGNIATARFTPDGRTVVFSAGLNGRPVETYTIPVEGGDIVPLGIPLSGIASISAKGDLALLLECELNRGECRGRLTRRPLTGGEIEFDEFDETVEFVDWSPSGDLAIVRARDDRVSIEYPIGEPLVRNRAGWISHLRFSPKGDKLAFFNHPDRRDNHGSVEVVDLMGTRTTLVSERQGLKGLAWAPAGDEVWFSGNERERTPQLRAVNLDRRERIVYEPPGWFDLLDIAGDGRVLAMDQQPTTWIKYSPDRADTSSPADWADVADVSADGKQLLVYEWGRAQAGRQVVSLRDGEGKWRRLGEGRPLAFSPNEQWVLAARDTANPELVLFPVKSGDARRLPNPGVAAFEEGFWVNQDYVAFAAREMDGSIRSYIQSVNGGPAQPIKDPEIRVALASADGTELAAYGSDPKAYHRLSATTGEMRGSFSGLEPYDELLRWGTDGSIYVRGASEDQIDLFRFDPAAGTRTPLREPLVPDRIGFLGIGATRITPDGSVVVYNYWNALGKLYLFEGLVSGSQLKG